MGVILDILSQFGTDCSDPQSLYQTGDCLCYYDINGDCVYTIVDLLYWLGTF